jgi:hypothetical protein
MERWHRRGTSFFEELAKVGACMFLQDSVTYVLNYIASHPRGP